MNRISPRYYLLAIIILLAANVVLVFALLVTRPSTALEADQPVIPLLSSSRTPTATVTATPDPCDDLAHSQDLDDLRADRRHFDEAFSLAQATPKDQLVTVILRMQDITHRVEGRKPSVSLEPVQSTEVEYMRQAQLVIANFLLGAEREIIQQQLARLADLRLAYENELVKALGDAYVPPTPIPSLTPTQVTPTLTPGPVTASAREQIYVLSGPGQGYAVVGALEAGERVNITARTASSDWVQVDAIDDPGLHGWIFTQSLAVDGAGPENVPVIETTIDQP